MGDLRALLPLIDDAMTSDKLDALVDWSEPDRNGNVTLQGFADCVERLIGSAKEEEENAVEEEQLTEIHASHGGFSPCASISRTRTRVGNAVKSLTGMSGTVE